VIPALSWRTDDTAGDPPSIELRKDQDTGIDHERIVALQDEIDTNILSVNFTNPWLIDQIEPGADVVLSTFNTTPEAVVDVLRGEYDPTGRMPFTVPASTEAVDRNASDVPGYAETFDYAYVDSDGNEWDLRSGLSYED
jgi:beta-glucosidase